MAHLLLIWHDRSRVAHQQLQKKDIVGLAHLKRLFPLLEKLHHVGCGRDKAGNRDLYFDPYCKLVLLYIWNPVIGSIAGLQQAAGLDHVLRWWTARCCGVWLPWPSP